MRAEGARVIAWRNDGHLWTADLRALLEDTDPAARAMALEALRPALEAAMAEELEEIDAIAENPEPPTFENTIVAMERTGKSLDRVLAYYRIWRSNLSTPPTRIGSPNISRP